MIIDREVTDIAISTVAAFGISLVLISPDYHLGGQLIIAGLMICLVSSFLHMVLRNLDKVSKRDSELLILINLIGWFIAVLGYFLGDIEAVEGVWDKINHGYQISLLGSLTLIAFIILLSKNAKILNRHSTSTT